MEAQLAPLGQQLFYLLVKVESLNQNIGDREMPLSYFLYFHSIVENFKMQIMVLSTGLVPTLVLPDCTNGNIPLGPIIP